MSQLPLRKRPKATGSPPPETAVPIADGEGDGGTGGAAARQELIKRSDWTSDFGLTSYLAVGLLAASLLTRFYRLDFPNQVVFDEVHFGGFSNGYIRGEHFFDIHPPLAKLILAFSGYFYGYDGHFDFSKIGNQYDGDFYLALRFPPALFGSMIPVLGFLTGIELGLRPWTALVGGIYLLLDLCFLIESRIIVTDALLMMFVTASVFCYCRLKNQEYGSYGHYLWMLLTGISLGGCISSKWTALATMGLLGIDTAITLVLNMLRRHKTIKEMAHDWLARGVLLLLVPLSIYGAVWVLHIVFLPRVGPGDQWMSHAFQKRLIGNTEAEAVVPQGIIASIFEFQWKLYVNNKGIVHPHNWMSEWWSWPITLKGIAYWSQTWREPDDPDRFGAIYLMGNPVVWWSTFAALAAFCAHVFAIPYGARATPAFLQKAAFLLGGYFMNLLPYILIARVTFLYHYLPSLLFLILFFALYLDYALAGLSVRHQRMVCVGVAALALAAFCYWSPMVYAFPMSKDEREIKRWFDSWR